VPASFTNAAIQDLLLTFLAAHRTLSDLRWSSSLLLPTPDAPFPALPALRALHDTDTFFVERFLSGRPRASVALHTLDRVAFYFEPARLLGALGALDPIALTRLHVACLDARATLLTLARMFPCLEELTLPAWCAWTKPRLLGRAARRALALARVAPPRRDWRRVALADAAPLFPRLRTIAHVDTGGAFLNRRGGSREPPACARKEVEALRARYPALESVNGWRIR
jgi:hypothetical protein